MIAPGREAIRRPTKVAEFTAMGRENNIDIVECVKCGHQMREADKEARDHVRKDEQVIGIFHPD